jgi:uncharacterized protein YprB with RNaseH-like and TPR domain
VPLARLSEPIVALPDASAGGDPSRYLYLDTETTGLSGGTGTLAFLVGIAGLERDALLLTQYLLTRFGAEPRLLHEIRSNWGSEAILVTFNGKSFDLPLLATRCRLADVDGPQPGQSHIDLLPLTRRAFARRWPACSLAQAENRLLGFSRVDDLPGSAAPQAWQDFLRRGRIGPLEGVVRHNRWDLVSLAALLPSLDRVWREPWRAGADTASLARAYLGRGRQQDALEVLQRSPETHRDAETVLLLARLFRRQGRWADAVTIWQHLAARDNPEALECLAKYHEHHTRCLATALSFAERLAEAPAGVRRQRRIRRKLESAARDSAAGQAP